jgi:hypothetical protein
MVSLLLVALVSCHQAAKIPTLDPLPARPHIPVIKTVALRLEASRATAATRGSEFLLQNGAIHGALRGLGHPRFPAVLFVSSAANKGAPLLALVPIAPRNGVMQPISFRRVFMSRDRSAAELRLVSPKTVVVYRLLHGKHELQISIRRKQRGPMGVRAWYSGRPLLSRSGLQIYRRRASISLALSDRASLTAGPGYVDLTPHFPSRTTSARLHMAGAGWATRLSQKRYSNHPRLSLVVVDASRRRQPGAWISVFRDGRPFLLARTDRAAEATLRLPAGRYSLRAGGTSTPVDTDETSADGSISPWRQIAHPAAQKGRIALQTGTRAQLAFDFRSAENRGAKIWLFAKGSNAPPWLPGSRDFFDSDAQGVLPLSPGRYSVMAHSAVGTAQLARDLEPLVGSNAVVPLTSTPFTQLLVVPKTPLVSTWQRHWISATGVVVIPRSRLASNARFFDVGGRGQRAEKWILSLKTRPSLPYAAGLPDRAVRHPRDVVSLLVFGKKAALPASWSRIRAGQYAVSNGPHAWFHQKAPKQWQLVLTWRRGTLITHAAVYRGSQMLQRCTLSKASATKLLCPLGTSPAPPFKGSAPTFAFAKGRRPSGEPVFVITRLLQRATVQ